MLFHQGHLLIWVLGDGIDVLSYMTKYQQRTGCHSRILYPPVHTELHGKHCCSRNCGDVFLPGGCFVENPVQCPGKLLQISSSCSETFLNALWTTCRPQLPMSVSVSGHRTPQPSAFGRRTDSHLAHPWTAGSCSIGSLYHISQQTHQPCLQLLHGQERHW